MAGSRTLSTGVMVRDPASFNVRTLMCLTSIKPSARR